MRQSRTVSLPRFHSAVPLDVNVLTKSQCAVNIVQTLQVVVSSDDDSPSDCQSNLNYSELLFTNETRCVKKANLGENSVERVEVFELFEEKQRKQIVVPFGLLNKHELATGCQLAVR